MQVPTISVLKQIFAERGVRPNRLRGQNFLVDAAQMAFVAEAAGVSREDVVLEPGPGPGGLTGLLVERAGRVVAAEIDAKLYEIVAERLGQEANLALIHTDIMGKGERIAPVVREALSEALSSMPGARLKVVANLPYAVSTAFIAAMLLEEPVPFQMTAMVQLEVAERLAAQADTEAYGYLSVVVQSMAQVRILRKVSPHCFWPQPQIDSAVVQITPDPARRAAVGNIEQFRKVAGGLFRFRRKQLLRAMQMAQLVSSASDAVQVLARVQIDPAARCEQLSVAQWVRLAQEMP